MLSFTLNNEPIVLSEDTSVQIVWYNPALNFKDFPGDVGLGINIPVNDHNKMLLGNPERFERYASENKRELPNFTIRFGGVLLIAGTLVIESANAETYNCWLRSDAGNMGKEHREKYIYDSISFNEEKTFENKSSYDPDTDDYACPEIYNPLFFKDKGQEVDGVRRIPNPTYGKKVWRRVGLLEWETKTDDREYIEDTVVSEDLTEAFLWNAVWRVNAKTIYLDIMAPDTTSNADAESIQNDLKVAVVSPMLYLNYVLKAMCNDAGFAIRDNFIAEHDDLKLLVLYHNFDITKIDFTSTEVEFVVAYNYNGMDIGSEPTIISATKIISTIHRYVDTFLYKDCLPKIALKDFIMSIQNLLNVFLHFVPGRKIIDVIDRETLLEEDAIDLEDYLTGEWEINEKKNNELKFSFDHDSNDQLIAEQWEDIEDYRSKEKEPVDEWSDLEALTSPEMDEIRFVRADNVYAQYKLWLLETTDEDGNNEQTKFIGWSRLSIGWQNAFFNFGQEEQEEIKTNFSTLVDEGQAGVRQKGNIRSELYAWESFTPRLLFCKNNNVGDYETANIALDWEKEETGLLETRWKYWKRIWATRQEVSTEANFHLSMLDHVIRNIYRKYRCREGEFMIEEMRTEFKLNDIGKTKIKGYKFDYAPKVYTLQDMWEISDPIWIDETIDFETDINFFL
jgi:hypothetical protein